MTLDTVTAPGSPRSLPEAAWNHGGVGRVARRTSKTTVVLGERDALLLCDLHAYGAMLADHIHLLYFAGRSRRRVNQRLHQLANSGLIVRCPLPLGLSAGLPICASGPGIPFIYRLGVAAAPLVAAWLGFDVAEVRRMIRKGTPTAIAHTLEIVRLRLHADKAVQEWNKLNGADDAAALEFVPERMLRHTYGLRTPGGSWRDESFRPDALLKLAGAGESWQHYFVEVDLGHTSSAEWGIKADIAVRYAALGLFQKRYGAHGFCTLIVTTGHNRRAHLQQLLLRRLRPEDAVRFSVATFADVTTPGLLAPIWHVPGQEETVSLKAWRQGHVGGDSQQ